MHAIITDVFSQLTKELCACLGQVLPKLSSTWWQECVREKLSVPQLQIVEQYRIDSLPGLNMAALLRIFDRNWFEISSVVALPPGTRNFVEEMQTIRNRWAHAGSEETGQDDLFRDLDTMQRLATAMDADSSFIEKIAGEKQKFIGKKEPDLTLATPDKEQTRPTEFQMGEIVRLRSQLMGF